AAPSGADEGAAQPERRPDAPDPAALPGGSSAVGGGSVEPDPAGQGDHAGAPRQDERADQVDPHPRSAAEVRADEEGAPRPRSLAARQGQDHHDPEHPAKLTRPQRPASGAGFTPAQRAGGLGGAPLAPPSSFTSGAGFTPAQRAGGLGGAPLAPPSSYRMAP